MEYIERENVKTAEYLGGFVGPNLVLWFPFVVWITKQRRESGS
jgi:hypothetical protein